MPEDPTILFVDKNNASDEDPLAHAFYFYTGPDKQQQRAVLLGYSLFGEVAGAPQADDGLPVSDALDLLTANEYENRTYMEEMKTVGGRYSMSFSQYLDYNPPLNEDNPRKINFIRLFLFQLYNARVLPFKTVPEQENKFDLDQINPAYLDRLVEFIETARERGIVVGLSLFSIQMLLSEGWQINPFNAALNVNGYIQATGNDAVDLFCFIKKPETENPATLEEKLYKTQYKLVSAVVERTRPYWNVVYEIFNEPGTDGDPHPIPNIMQWHREVATWLNDLLRDENGKRKRLVGITSSSNLMRELLNWLDVRTNGLPGLIDFVSLHGMQWGGDPARMLTTEDGKGGACGNSTYANPPTPASVVNGSSGYPGITEAYDDENTHNFQARHLALIFDTDAHYWAQKYPTVYVEEVLNISGSFNYRWPPPLLHEVTPMNCVQIGEKVLGMEQRQKFIYQATNLDNVVPLPHAPTKMPTDLEVKVEPVGDKQQSQLRLTFPTPDDEHEGYVVYLGPNQSSLGTRTSVFEGKVYFAKEDKDKQQLVVRFTPASFLDSEAIPVGPSAGVCVAVAARNGLVEGPMSEPRCIPGNDAELELSQTVLPVNTSIETRHDFRSDEHVYKVSFRNTGINKWENVMNYPGPYQTVLVLSLGVYMQCREMSGLGTLFLSMDKDNRDTTEDVLPGDTLTIYLDKMKLTQVYAQFYGEHWPIILPYSRQPLSFKMGMGELSAYVPPEENPDPPQQQPAWLNTVVYGHFGKTYTALSNEEPPAPDATPLKVNINDPRRMATQIMPENPTLGPAGFFLPLPSGHDFSLYLHSVTATSGPGNTIIRSAIELVNDTQSTGTPERRVHVWREGTDASVDIGVSAVKLHPVDLFYSGAHVDQKIRTYDVPGGGTKIASLAEFEGKYTATTAWSDTAISPNKTITWKVRPGCTGGQPKQLVITNHAPEPAKLVALTADIWENIPAEADSERQKSNHVTFDAKHPGPFYVELDDDATEHRYYVATLHGDKPATIDYEIMLKANDDGSGFKRVLKISASDYDSPLRVDYKTLEVRVDAQLARRRQGDEIHPIHAARILEFFNRVVDAQEIVNTIRDNPAIGRDTRRAYGVRRKLAERILEVRDTLPGRRFASLTQLDVIKGVGGDTFEDIVYTFEDDGMPTSGNGKES